jgi:23S rRNA (guanosine2251-2'-O)-methyltransferase
VTPPRGGRPPAKGGKGGGPKGASKAGGRGRGAAPQGRGGSSRSGGSSEGDRARKPGAGTGGGRRGGGGGGRNPLTQMGPQGRAPRASASTGLGGEQVEGRQAVRELLLANRRDAREIWLAQDLDPAPVLEDIRELAAEARVVVKEVGRGKLDAAARTDAPQGVIAFAKPLPEASLDDLIARRSGKPPPFLLCSDGITDPGNLGALLRSAECAGVTGVVLPQHRAVHVTPTVAKAAAGAVEHLPMTTVGGMPTAIKTMKDAGIWVVGLDERADKTLWDLTMDDAPVALVLGAEGPGLSRLVRERCDELVSIPMRGRVASLNVGTAGTLACFEIARARRQR